MKAATIKEIKEALGYRTQPELIRICLELARFKKENKELLTYILFESGDEAHFIESVKAAIASEFEQINYRNYYFIKKSVRKILRSVNKYIRYSKKKETEVELLLHFCNELKKIRPVYSENTALRNLFNRQVTRIKKALANLHEDLQYDYKAEIQELLR